MNALTHVHRPARAPGRIDAQMRGRSRIIAAVGIAGVLVTFMLYTALAGSAVQLSVYDARQLAAQRIPATREVELIGVAAGPVRGTLGDRITFHVTDSHGGHPRLVVYRGSVPDAFKVGRNVVVQGKLDASGTFQATPGSLQTKCPSRFQSRAGQ
jgi:cytochrome c-type biogenesis protein CcmE